MINLDEKSIILKAEYHFDRKMLIFGLLFTGFGSFMFFWNYFVGDLFNYGRSTGESSDIIFGIACSISQIFVGLIARLEFFFNEKFVIVTERNIVLQNIRPFAKIELIEYSNVSKVDYVNQSFIRLFYGNKKIHNFQLESFVKPVQFQEFFNIIQQKFLPR